jgi:hypothetical protein
MSLELVITEKIIKTRKILLSNYLKNNNVGILNENDALFFKHIFAKFYTPNEKDTKFNISQISNVAIVKDKWEKKCFSILVDNIWYPTSITPLSGSSRNEKRNLERALRNAIEPQITNFRVCNPLNPNDICPVTKKILGEDAVVDHQIPFHILAEEWIKNNTNICYIYNLENFNYILQEPHYTSWFNFHFKKSILRWLSKEGNKYAHTLYDEKGI